MKPKGYRDQDDTLSIKADVKQLKRDMLKIKAGEVMRVLKGGILGLFIGGGLALTGYGISLIVFATGQREAMVVGAEFEHGRVMRVTAAEECETACQHGGMELQHARLQRVDDDSQWPHYRVSLCSCIQTTDNTRMTRAVLWNDNAPYPADYCENNYHCVQRVNDETQVVECRMYPSRP